MVSHFQQRVLAIVKRIPAGSVLTYTAVARLAGKPTAARAVGNILHHNYDTTIPCYRVIRSDGKLGGYNRGRKKKQELLKLEGAI